MPINFQMGSSNWINRPTRNPAPFGRSELQVVFNCSGDLFYGRLWDFSERGLCLQLRGSLLVDVGSSHLVRVNDVVSSAFFDLDVIVCWSRVGSASTYVGVEFSSSSQAVPLLEKFSPPDPWLSVNQKIDRSV